MTAKEYLQQYLDADREIQAKVDQIARLRDLATRTTSKPAGGRVQSSAENKLERIISKIADMESEVDGEIERLADKRRVVQTAIDAVQNATQRSVLERRYINGEPWSRICTALFGKRDDFPDRYDSYLRNVYRWHGLALQVVRMSLNVTIEG